MSENVGSMSAEFRNRLVKVIKDDSFFEHYLSTNERITFPEKYKPLVDNINGFVIISNYTTGLYEYISDGIKSHLGYDVEGFSNEELTNFIVSIIHSDHSEFLLNVILPAVFKYFKEHSTPATGTDFRYTCCLKVKDIQNEYYWYLIDTAIIEADKNGFPLRTLITCTNINQFKKDDYIYYNIVKKNSNGLYEVVLDGTGNCKGLEHKLTSREVQIINLISQGLTNKQIAYRLVISINTVQTHRKSIIKKTKCRGTAELVNFAFSRGLL